MKSKEIAGFLAHLLKTLQGNWLNSEDVSLLKTENENCTSKSLTFSKIL